MPTQRIPLFQGLVQPIHVGIDVTTFTDIFIPPDTGSKAPQTYEVHLWLMPNNPAALGNANLDIAIAASEGPLASATKVGFLYRGAPFNGGRPIKVLDGVPIRGNVQLSAVATAPSGGTNGDHYPNGPQLWGYYHVAGRGATVELERRSICRRDLAGFGAGVPFAFPIPAGGPDGAVTAKQTIHVFEPGRFDDIAISLDSVVEGTPPAAASAIVVWELFFEDVNGVSVADPAHVVGFKGNPTSTLPLFDPAYGGPPDDTNARMLTEFSPYVFKGTFGGHPRLHHIAARLTRGEDDAGVRGFLHGHFVRH